MRKVPNKKIIRILTYRTMKEKKWKNMIAVLAIALTTLLFTALFTVGGSMMSSLQEATMRQVGSSAHGGYKRLSVEEYEKVKASGGYQDISYDIIAGFATNKELKAIQTEVRYAEDKMAKWSFSYPEEGRMPVGSDECAASSKVLEALGIPLKVGEKVPLIITTHDEEGNEKNIQTEFTLSGFWYANDASHAQELWVSRNWVVQNISLLHENYEERLERCRNAFQEGSIQAAVLFNDSFDIEAQMEELTRYAGLDANLVSVSVNWAYGMATMDSVTIALGVLLLFIIILSGYLIIYNIFYINVTVDIRYYGLLKTIGTTGKQLRHMVRGQAFLLSLFGIPLGLLTGWFVGKGILPAIYAAISTDGVTNVVLNPWLFAGSAAFALAVVYLSCIKPCRLATGVSPMEAVRYVENMQYKKKEKKTAKVTPAYLALSNIARNKRKAMVVIASLSLSLILINGTYALVKGFSFDEYVNSYLLGDMQVSHCSIVNFSSGEFEHEAITSNFVNAVRKIDGVEKAHVLYTKDGILFFSDEMTEKFKNFYDSETVQKEISSIEKSVAGEVAVVRKTNVDSYFLPDTLLSELTIKAGKYDREKFAKGGYALVADTKEWMTTGDKITIGNYGDDSLPQKELEIMAVTEIPYAISTRMKTLCGANLVLSEKDFYELYDVNGGLHICIEIEKEKEEQVSDTLDELIKSEYPELVLTTKKSLKKEFARETNMFMVVGGFLGFILALIGVLNFTNAMITGILSKKQEFAMMQAVGMTGKQLRKMLTMEGMWYGIWTVGIAATLGNMVSYGLIYLIGKNMAYFEWSFHILPLLAGIPVIAVVSVSLPEICYYVFCRKSIVERLRMAEV